MRGWRDGQEIAEAAAWAEHGKNNSWWYIYGRRLAPIALIAGAVGALGWAAHWLWTRSVAMLTGGDGIPVRGWIPAVAVLFVLTVLAIRGRRDRIRSFAELVLTGLAILVAWSAFGLFMLGSAG